VITFNDADDTATIHTHQRRIITKLLNNRAATKVDDLTFDGTAGAVFEIPADLISFRSGRRKLSPAQAQAAHQARMAREYPLLTGDEPLCRLRYSRSPAASIASAWLM
jgi:hypothetical protein